MVVISLFFIPYGAMIMALVACQSMQHWLIKNDRDYRPARPPLFVYHSWGFVRRMVEIAARYSTMRRLQSSSTRWVKVFWTSVAFAVLSLVAAMVFLIRMF